MICKALPINHSEAVKHSQVTDSIVLSFTVEHYQMLHYFTMENRLLEQNYTTNIKTRI